VPRLPVPSLLPMQLSGNCSAVDQDTEFGGASPSVATHQRMPTQGG